MASTSWPLRMAAGALDAQAARHLLRLREQHAREPGAATLRGRPDPGAALGTRGRGGGVVSVT